MAGLSHSCALHQDGTVSCWGLADAVDGTGAAVRAPARVPGIAGIRALAAGGDGTCGIAGEGSVRCWGRQSQTVAREDGAPLLGVTGVALGPGYGCAINPEGTHCWGKNERGQLARLLSLEESTRALLAEPGAQRFLGAGQAVFVHDGADRLCAWGSNGNHQVAEDDVTTVYTSAACGTVRDVAQLTIGSDHACVRHSNGAFSCWGERYYGQLGLGGGVNDTLDVPPYGKETRLAGPVRDLVAGASHTCALLEDGAVTCFGLDSKGQVGPNPTTTAEEVRAPAPVTGFAGAVTALGSGSTAQHTCAIVASHQVQCWGSNADGQLGDGVTTRDPARFSRGPVTVRW